MKHERFLSGCLRSQKAAFWHNWRDVYVAVILLRLPGGWSRQWQSGDLAVRGNSHKITTAYSRNVCPIISQMITIARVAMMRVLIMRVSLPRSALGGAAVSCWHEIGATR